MIRFHARLAFAAGLLAAVPAIAQNAPSNSTRVQGVPDGYGDPVQVTLVGPDGSEAAGTATAGDVAADAVDSGNPVKIGCKANNGLPTAVAALDRANAWCSVNGALANAVVAVSIAGADAVSNTVPTPYSVFDANVFEYVRGATFNGTTWDRVRSASQSTVSSGTGIAAAGILAVVDDTSPQAVTENSMGMVRMGTNHSLLVSPFNPYPYSSVNAAAATPLTASSGNVANAAAVATLATSGTNTTYISGFTCTPGGSTAAALVNVTVVGVITGTMTYTVGTPAGAAIMGTPLVVQFNPAVPASAVNTTIVVTMPALGAGNTNAACVATGFRM